MGQRIYKVHFEMFTDGKWQTNMFSRDVAVSGGAEQAIKVAVQRERRDNGQRRIRVEAVELLAMED